MTGYVVEGNEQYTFNESGTEMTAVKFVLGGKEIPTDVKIAVTPGVPKRPNGSTALEAAAKSKNRHRKESEVVCKFSVVDAEGDHMTVAAVSEGEVVIE